MACNPCRAREKLHYAVCCTNQLILWICRVLNRLFTHPLAILDLSNDSKAQLMSHMRWRATSNFTLLHRSNNVWPHVLTKHQNVRDGAPLFYRCEVECVGRKPQPVFAGADNSDTLVSLPSLEASSICYIFTLWGSFEETPLSVSR